VLGAACLLLATTAGRLWGQGMAITLLVTGLTAIVGAGAEESFQHSQAALHGIPVRQAVRQPTWTLQSSDVLTPDMLRAIDQLNRPALPVVSDGRLVGLVTRRDLATARARSGGLTVTSLMRRDFQQVAAESDLWQAQQLMLGGDQDTLPVTEDERLLGLLTAADVRAAFVATPRPSPAEAPQLISPSPSPL
jgi:CBS domain-containing protein